MAVIEYTRSAMASPDDKIRTLRDSVQRALDGLESRIQSIPPVVVENGGDGLSEAQVRDIVRGYNYVPRSGFARVAFSGSYNDLSDKPTIPSGDGGPSITEATVGGWGFTKNTGTITEIRMNGASKGTGGSVDLGTVLTEHQDVSSKLEAGSLKTINGESLVGSGDITISGESGGGLPSDLVNYVIAEGYDGDWHYTKWKNGKCEIWRQYTATFAMTTSSVGWYTTSADRTLTLPFAVEDDAVVTGSGTGGAYVIRGEVTGTTLTWRPYRVQSSSSTERTFGLRILGRWK